MSRNCFDIEGLGGTHIENFFNDGLLKVPGDIFRLPKRIDEIKKREGWGDLSVRNLVAAIEARKTISLDRFINAHRHPADRRGDRQDPGAGIRRRRRLAGRDADGRQGAQEASPTT